MSASVLSRPIPRGTRPVSARPASTRPPATGPGRAGSASAGPAPAGSASARALAPVTAPSHASHGGSGVFGPTRRRLSASLRDDTGASTAEYAITVLAACGFAAVLVLLLKSGEVRELLMNIITSALSLGQ